LEGFEQAFHTVQENARALEAEKATGETALLEAEAQVDLLAAAGGGPHAAALTAAISATITSQVEALKQNMAAEYAQQEQEVLDRIAQLETRLK